MDPAKRQIAAWQSGTLPKSDAIRFMQRIGLADGTKSVEDIIEELDGAGVNLG